VDIFIASILFQIFFNKLNCCFGGGGGGGGVFPLFSIYILLYVISYRKLADRGEQEIKHQNILYILF
jgi:hypothetical protein